MDARSAGRLEDAEVAFNHAIKLNPRHPDVWFDLGNLMLSQRRFAEALEQYEQALHLQPDDDDAALNAGHALMGIGRHEQAEGAFARLTQRAPRRGDAWQALGAARHELGDASGAIEAFRKAHAVNPEDLAARFNLGMSLSDGLIHRVADAAEFDEAIEHLVACVAHPTPGVSEVNVRKRLLKLRQLLLHGDIDGP